MAPFVLTLGSGILRRRILGESGALLLWQMLDRYFSYFEFRAKAITRFGLEMDVSPSGRVEKEIFFFGEWEPLFSRYLLDKPPSNGSFVDLGANIGYFTLLASKRFAYVHAIEASPKIAGRLQENVSRNMLDNVRVHNTAIGGEAGYIDFYFDTNQSGGSSVFPGEGRVLEAKVPIATFLDILADVPLDGIEFIKVDIEGMEHQVLQMLLEIQERLAPNVEIMVEYHPGAEQALELQRLVAQFRLRGFVPFVLQGSYDPHEYLDQSKRTRLAMMDIFPSESCDIILKRAGTA